MCIKCINYASIKFHCNFHHLAKMIYKIKLEFMLVLKKLQKVLIQLLFYIIDAFFYILSMHFFGMYPCVENMQNVPLHNHKEMTDPSSFALLLNTFTHPSTPITRCQKRSFPGSVVPLTAWRIKEELMINPLRSRSAACFLTGLQPTKKNSSFLSTWYIFSGKMYIWKLYGGRLMNRHGGHR